MRLEDMETYRLKRLHILTRRYLTNTEFQQRMDQHLRKKYGARSKDWNLPAAAAHVHNNIVKLISQRENIDDHK